jgi:hypothetical protein
MLTSLRTAKLPPHQLRVLAEQEDLILRITRLEKFIKSETFDSLDFEDKVLLRLQLEAMTSYHTILLQRIARF